MKKIYSLLLATSICVSSYAFTDSTKTILQQGTPINVKLMEDLNSKKAEEGETILFEVADDVILNDRVLIRKGCKARGTITKAQGSKMLGKKGELNFSIDYVTMQTGKIIKVTTEINKAGKSRGGAAVAGAIVASPLFLLVKGKQVKYEAGKIFSVYVEKDYEL